MPIRTIDDLRQRREQARKRFQAVGQNVIVCAGTGCVANGSLQVFAELQRQSKEAGLPVTFSLDAEEKALPQSPTYIAHSGCHGFCQMGPLLHIMPDDVLYCKVKVDDVAEIVEQTLKLHTVIERLLYVDPANQEKRHGRRDIPFYAGQSRHALKRCGVVDPESLDAYLATDGLIALEKALTDMSPKSVQQEVENSGLRGRGGAGFLTGLKWKLGAESPGGEKYIICNGDEGDPGAFMDRSIMEGDPFAVIEGMMLAAYTVGASKGYIYVRHEYPLAVMRLKKAVETLHKEGLLGENILGRGFKFEVEIQVGAGAFVCGEETALIGSIQGRRGMPRTRPPFPTTAGLFGRPTVINNVETIANVEGIISQGADHYSSIGTRTSKGTKVFALTGKINNTGLVEVAMGATIRQIIYDIGGGIPNGKKFKAVQMGGPSGGCIDANYLDLAIDYESLRTVGAMMGSGGMVVMDETTCMVDIARYFVNFCSQESCGKCVPCRDGLKRLEYLLIKITEGEGKMEDLERIEQICNTLQQASLCQLGQSAANPVRTTLHYFRDEYIAHIEGKRCPAGVCKSLISYTITDACTACGLCKRNCPVTAISGEKKVRHVIDPAICTRCGNCYAICPFNAIIVTDRRETRAIND